MASMREPLPWADVWMQMAHTIAQRSKDPSTQIGAVIIAQDQRMLSSGFNGPPRKINDSLVPWNRPDKYPYVFHAEENALWFGLQAHRELTDATMYITGSPCSRCMLKIVRAEITRVVTGVVVAALNNQSDWELTCHLAKMGGVTIETYKPSDSCSKNINI